MGKPDKKLKKIILIMGITGAVYGVFRYLLPLVIPFLLGGILAVVLRPGAAWVAAHCQVTIHGKKRGIPIGMAGVLELFAMMALLFAGIYAGGRRVVLEAVQLMQRVPQWVEGMDQWLTDICHQLEQTLCLQENWLVYFMREMLQGFMDTGKEAIMPFLMINSVSLFRAGVKITVFFVVVFVTVALFLREMGCWKNRCINSIFRSEWRLIERRLRIVANAYIKTQGLIMVLTTVICTAGFWVMGNAYFILAGVGIGILDALPVFGTGTVLIPWGVALLCFGQWKKGLFLIALYLVCYFVREFMEAKMMGDKVGLSPLETLLSMYVGLQLFGITGFFLGPVGLLLIEDLVELLESG